MPFKSKAQRRFMYAAEERGDVPKGTASRWEDATKGKKLPERVKKSEAPQYSFAPGSPELLQQMQQQNPQLYGTINTPRPEPPMSHGNFAAHTGLAGAIGGGIYGLQHHGLKGMLYGAAAGGALGGIGGGVYSKSQRNPEAMKQAGEENPLDPSTIGTTLGGLLGSSLGVGSTIALSHALPKPKTLLGEIGQGILSASLPPVGTLLGGSVGYKYDKMRDVANKEEHEKKKREKNSEYVSDLSTLDYFLKRAQAQQSQQLPQQQSELDELHKHELHQQQMQFAHEQHMMDMAERGLDIKHKQEAFELSQQQGAQSGEVKLQLSQQKAEQDAMHAEQSLADKRMAVQQKLQASQAAAKAKQMGEQPPQPTPEQAQAQMQHQHRQNAIDGFKQAGLVTLVERLKVADIASRDYMRRPTESKSAPRSPKVEKFVSDYRSAQSSYAGAEKKLSRNLKILGAASALAIPAGVGYALYHSKHKPDSDGKHKEAGLAKMSAILDEYGQPLPEKPSATLPMLTGAAVGAGAGHYMFPSAEVKALRQLIEKAAPEAIEGLQRKALYANAPRVGAGIGAGLLAGYLTNKMVNG